MIVSLYNSVKCTIFDITVIVFLVQEDGQVQNVVPYTI